MSSATTMELFNKEKDEIQTSHNKRKKELTAPPLYTQEEFECFFDNLSKHGIINEAAKETLVIRNGKEGHISRGWVIKQMKKSVLFNERVKVAQSQSNDYIEHKLYKVGMGDEDLTVVQAKMLSKLIDARKPQTYRPDCFQDNRTQNTQINISMDDLIENAEKRINGNNNQ
mgnify:CR=1 FL=1